MRDSDPASENWPSLCCRWGYEAPFALSGTLDAYGTRGLLCHPHTTQTNVLDVRISLSG